MTKTKSFRERMTGQGLPDFERYQTFEDCIDSKFNTVDHAWELFNRAKEDLEPQAKQDELYKCARDAGKNWRQYVIMSERHYDEELTLKSLEIIAVAMDSIPNADKDEELSRFWKFCNSIKKGRITDSGRVYDAGRIRSLNMYKYFKQELLDLMAVDAFAGYELFDNVMESLGL